MFKHIAHNMTRGEKLSLVLYVAAVLILALGFWWFRFVWLTSYSTKAYVSTAASFSAADQIEDLTFDNPLGKAMLVHFIDRKCPCTRYSLPFIEKLQVQYTDSISHIEIDAEKGHLKKHPVIEKLVERLPASPAVAIWNSEGQLAYFGSYTTGTFCGEGKDMVSYILQAIDKGQQPRWINQEVIGCMCEWPRQEAL